VCRSISTRSGAHVVGWSVRHIGTAGSGPTAEPSTQGKRRRRAPLPRSPDGGPQDRSVSSITSIGAAACLGAAQGVLEPAEAAGLAGLPRAM
jgi:hypothetical protein